MSEPTTPDHRSASHKSTFFRQSGWMMISAVAGGALMFGVQIISKKFLNDVEYSAFAVLIQVINWMTIPAMGLQMVFSQQAAAALTEKKRHQLVGTMKAVMLWTFCIWLVMMVTAFLFRGKLIEAFKLSNPASLWLTVAIGLVMLWFPIYQGLLQGRQNFLWLGWSNIVNGLGRVAMSAAIVIFLHGQAAGLMTGVLIGLVVALALAASQNLDLWREHSEPFDWQGWLKRVVPLTLGFGASQFLFSADAIVVQNYLGEGGNAADYMFGATLCRAIVLFTAPLATVMFPKLVHSRASSQKTNLMGLTLIGTGALSLFAAIGLSVTAPFIMKIFSKGNSASIVPLIPLFAGTMIPLGMGNVLLNNLLAHSRFKIAPAVLVLTIIYWIALQHFHYSFKVVIETFGVFSLLFLGLCAFFTVVDKDKAFEEIKPQKF